MQTRRLTLGILCNERRMVVCPSTKPIKLLMRSVSSGSPPSTRSLVLGLFVSMLLTSSNPSFLLCPTNILSPGGDLAPEHAAVYRSLRFPVWVDQDLQPAFWRQCWTCTWIIRATSAFRSAYSPTFGPHSIRRSYFGANEISISRRTRRWPTGETFPILNW